jgi:hypothetical protein
MSYLVLCRNCGYDISSSDLLESAKDTAESTNSCRQCHSKEFDIVEQNKDVRVLADDDSDEEGSDPQNRDQSSLDEY